MVALYLPPHFFIPGNLRFPPFIGCDIIQSTLLLLATFASPSSSDMNVFIPAVTPDFLMLQNRPRRTLCGGLGPATGQHRDSWLDGTLLLSGPGPGLGPGSGPGLASGPAVVCVPAPGTAAPEQHPLHVTSGLLFYTFVKKNV